MADRYWVGGTATWDGTAGTKWSTTSGGAGGASVPTLNDDVYFDQNSNSGTNAFTVTISSSRVCRNITVQNLDGAMTLAGSGSLSVYGNLTFPSTRLTVSNTGILTIRGQSSAVNTGGVLIANISLGSRSLTRGSVVTESVTLAGSLNVSNSLFIGCNLNTQGFTVQARDISIDHYVITLNFSNSHIIVSKSIVSTALYVPNVSIVANNTDITFSNPTSTRSFDLYPLTPSFRNITIRNDVANPISANLCVFRTGLTAENLTIPGITSDRLYVVFNSNCVISNTIDIQSSTSASSKKRVALISSLENQGEFGWNLGGINLYATNVDFYGIKATASNVNCARCGDLGFNSGIVFDNSRVLYWTGTNLDVWSDSKWSLTDNQPGSELYPLAQDDVIINDATPVTSISIDKSASVRNLTIDRTFPITILYSGPSGSIGDILSIDQVEPVIKITGDITLPIDKSLITFPSGHFRYYGSGIKNIRGSYLSRLVVDTYGGTVRIQNDIEFSDFQIVSGTFDSNGYNLKFNTIDSGLIYPFTGGGPVILYNIAGAINLRWNNQWLYFFDIYNVTKVINFKNSTIECNTFVALTAFGYGSTAPFNAVGYNPPVEIDFTDSRLILKGAELYLDGLFKNNNYPPNPPNLITYNLNTVVISNTQEMCLIGCNYINNLQLNRVGAFNLDFGYDYTGESRPVAIGSWEVSGSPGQIITISNPTTLNKIGGGIVQADYINISNSTVQPPDTWYAGANSINAGNNINWIFENPYDPETSGDFFILLG